MVLISLEAEKYGQEADERVFERIYSNIEERIQPAPRVRRLKPYLAAAAVLVLVLSGSIYLLLNKNTSKPSIATPVSDVQPGGNKAVLTLADGSTLAVDSSVKQIAQKGGKVQQQNGRLQYVSGGTTPQA